jgi:hypothetical protein
MVTWHPQDSLEVRGQVSQEPLLGSVAGSTMTRAVAAFIQAAHTQM